MEIRTAGCGLGLIVTFWSLLARPQVLPHHLAIVFGVAVAVGVLTGAFVGVRARVYGTCS
jgi:hypothetical protein